MELRNTEIWQKDTSGSGLTLAVLDARYLKLDCSNDPLTSDLRLNGALGINKDAISTRIIDINSDLQAGTIVRIGYDSSLTQNSVVIGYQADFNTNFTTNGDDLATFDSRIDPTNSSGKWHFKAWRGSQPVYKIDSLGNIYIRAGQKIYYDAI